METRECARGGIGSRARECGKLIMSVYSQAHASLTPRYAKPRERLAKHFLQPTVDVNGFLLGQMFHFAATKVSGEQKMMLALVRLDSVARNSLARLFLR